MRKTPRSEYFGKQRIHWSSVTGLQQVISSLQNRDDTKFIFVNPRVATTGDGTSIDKAYKTFTEAVARIRALSTAALKKGYTIFLMSGLSIEKAGIVIDFDDLWVIGTGLPDDAVLFGSGATGSVSAATDHLLKISGGSFFISGVTMYTHKDTKAAVYLGAADADGYTGSFGTIQNCFISPQGGGNGQGYGFYLEGACMVTIDQCDIRGCKSAAVLVTDSTVRGGNRNIIRNNFIVGCKYGLSITGIAHNTTFEGNTVIDGSDADEVLTKCLVASAGFSSGGLFIVNNYLEAADKAGSITNGGTPTAVHIGNQYSEA